MGGLMAQAKVDVERMGTAQLWTLATKLSAELERDLAAYATWKSVAANAKLLRRVLLELKMRGTQMELFAPSERPVREARAGNRRR